MDAATALSSAVATLPDNGRVRLRRWQPEDAPQLVAACRDPEIPRFTRVPNEYTAEDAERFLAESDRGLQAGTSCDLAVVDPAAGAEVLGAVGLVEIDWAERRAEAGYWTAPGARGRGVAVAALRLLTTWSFDRLPLSRLQLTPFTDNRASQKVAERAGYRREGVLRSYLRSKAGQVDVVMYARLRGDDGRPREPAPPG